MLDMTRFTSLKTKKQQYPELKQLDHFSNNLDERRGLIGYHKLFLGS